MPNDAFIPALRLRILTRVYDPLMERWTAAAQVRRAVIDALDLHPGLRLLELGCGPGRLAIAIKKRNPESMIDALDADPEILVVARRNAADAGVDVRFHQADIARLPNLGPFDLVYSTLVFHHLLPEGKREALAGVRRALKAGGRFVIADFGRPRGAVQWMLSNAIHPLDGVRNTAPHRSGQFEGMLHATFTRVDTVAFWRTAFGTIELFVCVP